MPEPVVSARPDTERPRVPGPLSHLRVVEVAELVSAPFTGRLLTDLGADVTKVEPPRSGDASRQVGPFPADRPDPEASALFGYLNRGKRSVTLDWRSPTGADLLDRLIEGADVLLVDEGFGRTHDELVELSNQRERLIVTSVTPFGLVGPRAHWRGSHATACAYGGITLYNGEQAREPITPPFFLGSFQAGLAGAISTLVCVFARWGRHGRGQVVDIGMADVLSSIHTGNSATHWVFGSREWIRHGRRTAAGLYPNTMLRTQDGWFRIQAMSQKEWRGLLKMIGDPAWGDDPKYQDRIVNQELYADLLDSYIEEYLVQHTKQELFDRTQELELPFSPVRQMDEVAEERQLVYRKLFEPAVLGNGAEVRMPGPPYRWLGEGAPKREQRPVLRAPRLGEDNAEVFGGELGLTEAQLTELRSCRVI